MRKNLSALKTQMLGADSPPCTIRTSGQSPSLCSCSAEGSPAFLHRLTEWLGELLPTAQTVHIPDASHLMHEENRAAVNTAILEDLTAQSPAKS